MLRKTIDVIEWEGQYERELLAREQSEAEYLKRQEQGDSRLHKMERIRYYQRR